MLFRVVEESLGSWISLVVSSFVFGIPHLINPASTLLGAVFISIEAGVLLAAAYMVTRRLWLAMGFHMAWNYTQSGIFSGIVSGSKSSPGPDQEHHRGAAAADGRQFWPGILLDRLPALHHNRRGVAASGDPPRPCRAAVLEARGLGCRSGNDSYYSHSIVPGGFDVTSYTTRETPRTSLMMRVATRARKAWSKG